MFKIVPVCSIVPQESLQSYLRLQYFDFILLFIIIIIIILLLLQGPDYLSISFSLDTTRTSSDHGD